MEYHIIYMALYIYGKKYLQLGEHHICVSLLFLRNHTYLYR